jgi:hypothetical protein
MMTLVFDNRRWTRIGSVEGRGGGPGEHRAASAPAQA